MGNEIYHYFGIYLEIKVKKIGKKERFFGCKNGHRSNNSYCSKCGEIVKEQTKTVSGYPTWIYGELVSDEWEEALEVITPPKLYKTGIIIAIGNLSNKPRGEWLYLSRWDYDPETKEFPTESEIDEMTRKFITNYEDIITALENSQAVDTIKIKAGYVLNAEY